MLMELDVVASTSPVAHVSALDVAWLCPTIRQPYGITFQAKIKASGDLFLW